MALFSCVSLEKAGLVMGTLRLSATLLGCLVCVICNSISFLSFLFKLYDNDCSHIEAVHLLFRANFMNIF